MNYQRFITSLSNQDLQQEIKDNEKLQLKNEEKIINIIGIEAWHNFSDYTFPEYINVQIKKIKAENYRLAKIYILLENELCERQR